jgi:hypothetical protein
MKRRWSRSHLKEIRREELFQNRISKAPPRRDPKEMQMKKTHSARKRGKERMMTLISLAISIGLLILWMKTTLKVDQGEARRPIIITSTRAKIKILKMASKP